MRAPSTASKRAAPATTTFSPSFPASCARSFTSAAEISAITPDLLRLLGCFRRGNGNLRDRFFSRRDLLVVTFRHRLLLLRRRPVRRCRCEVGGRRLLLSGGDSVRDHTHD